MIPVNKDKSNAAREPASEGGTAKLNVQDPRPEISNELLFLIERVPPRNDTFPGETRE